MWGRSKAVIAMATALSLVGCLSSLVWLRLHNVDSLRNQEKEERLAFSSPVEGSPHLSSCLLIMDDNHWLVEWLAYHWTRFHLRHIIVAVDPRSRTSPVSILERWKGRLEYEIWNDQSFAFLPSPSAASLQEINLARQQTFLAHCLRRHKELGHSWVMTTDTDEFLVLNPRFEHLPYKHNAEGSLWSVLTSSTTSQSLCHGMPRLQISPEEVETPEDLGKVPAGWSPLDFLTTRWRYAGGPLVGPKNIVDVSAIPFDRLPASATDQHRVVPHVCPEKHTIGEQTSLFLVFHYFGTLEQFEARDDPRNYLEDAGRPSRYSRFRGAKNGYVGNQTGYWLHTLESIIGSHEMRQKLDGAGRVHGWEDANQSYEFASVESLTRPSFYSKARSDRSGAAILDMLMAHAFAFANNMTYLGACPEHDWQYRQDTEELIQSVGLERFLRLGCPSDVDNNDGLWPRDAYATRDLLTLFTTEYLSYVRSFAKYPRGGSTRCRAVVHVRRGDIRPCKNSKFSNRYLPNSHYLSVIERYIPLEQRQDICIVSETDAFEGFDDFAPYRVLLDESANLTWSEIIAADYIVISKSSFSLVPALLNRHAATIYTPFMYKQLPNWQVVDRAILEDSEMRAKKLSQTLSCGTPLWYKNCTKENRCHLFSPNEFYESLPMRLRRPAYNEIYGSKSRSFHTNWARCVSNHFDWTYVHIRKAGGTTMNEVVQKAECQVEANVMWSRAADRLYNEIGETNFIQHMKSIHDSSFLFSFVRDPISRFVSAMGQVAKKPKRLTAVGCLSGNSTQDMLCAISRLRGGDLFNEHFVPASVELLQMSLPTPSFKIAVMPLEFMDEIIASLGLEHVVRKQNVKVDSRYSMLSLGPNAIMDLCHIYEVDVHMMRHVGLEVPACDDHIPLVPIEHTPSGGRTPAPPHYSDAAFVDCKLLRPGDTVYRYGPWDAAPIVNTRFKLVFFAIPKVGSTGFKQLFRRMEGFEDFLSDTHPLPHAPRRNGLTYLYDFPPVLADQILTDPSWKKAIFLRDPKERFLSGYLDKARQNHYIQHHCCPTSRNHDSLLYDKLDCRNRRAHHGPETVDTGDVILSLPDFIDVVYHGCKDPHWAPQTDRMEPKYWKHIDFIGNFSALAHDTRRLLESVNAWETFGRSGWANEEIFASSARHATNASTHVDLLESPALKKSLDLILGDEYALLSSPLEMDTIRSKTFFDRAVAANSSCNCFNDNDNNRCCQRLVLRAHKMGVVLTRRLFYRTLGILTDVPHPRFIHDRSGALDYRHVVVTRSWLESMVSGYLYHKSGRECWLNQDGKPRAENKTFEWESHLSNPISSVRNKTLCHFLAEATEEDGMRAYVDLSISHFYAGILPYRDVAISDGKNQSLFVCYEDLSRPETQSSTYFRILEWLHPGGHHFKAPSDMSKPYAGGHSTTKDQGVRDRLLMLAKKYDTELFGGYAARADRLLGCGGEFPDEPRKKRLSTEYAATGSHTVLWKGKEDLKTFMKAFFDEKNTVCDLDDDVQMLNITFQCNHLFEKAVLGTGNFLAGLYAIRLAARMRGNLQVSVSCFDADDVLSTLILPWVLGNFPVSRAVHQSFPAALHRAHCGNIDSCPIGLMHDEMRYELRRMAVALVGIPRGDHPMATTVRQWVSENHESPGGAMLQVFPTISSNMKPIYPDIVLDDAVIHFRCGDLMSSEHSQFAFLDFSGYAKHVSQLARKIGIVTQPFDGDYQSRARDRKMDTRQRCGTVVKEFVRYLEKRFPASNVTIHSTESIALTYARMIMANQTIVAISTFGIFPAIASFGRGYARLPDAGNRTGPYEQKSATNQWLLHPLRLDKYIDGLTLFSEHRILMVKRLKDMWAESNGKDNVLSWFNGLNRNNSSDYFVKQSDEPGSHEAPASPTDWPSERLLLYDSENQHLRMASSTSLSEKWKKNSRFSEIMDVTDQGRRSILPSFSPSNKVVIIWHAVPKTAGTTIRRSIFDHINSTCPEAGRLGGQSGAFSSVNQMGKLIQRCNRTTYFGLGGRQRFDRRALHDLSEPLSILHLVGFRPFAEYAVSAINQIVKTHGLGHCEVIRERLRSCRPIAELSYDQYSKVQVQSLLDSHLSRDDRVILYDYRATDQFFNWLSHAFNLPELDLSTYNTERSNQTCAGDVLERFFACFEDKL